MSTSSSPKGAVYWDAEDGPHHCQELSGEPIRKLGSPEWHTLAVEGDRAVVDETNKHENAEIRGVSARTAGRGQGGGVVGKWQVLREGKFVKNEWAGIVESNNLGSCEG